MFWKKNSGFSLIEIIVVIAIIGILAVIVLNSLSRARTEARVAVTKSGLVGLRSAISMCCVTTENHLLEVSGQEMCSQATGVILPDEDTLQVGVVTYTVERNCNEANPGYIVEIDGHQKDACNGTWRVNETRMELPPDC